MSFNGIKMFAFYSLSRRSGQIIHNKILRFVLLVFKNQEKRNRTKWQRNDETKDRRRSHKCIWLTIIVIDSITKIVQQMSIHFGSCYQLVYQHYTKTKFNFFLRLWPLFSRPCASQDRVTQTAVCFALHFSVSDSNDIDNGDE